MSLSVAQRSLALAAVALLAATLTLVLARDRRAAGALGIAHPVLPCRAKLVLSYRAVEAAAEVADHRAVGAGLQFELTQALAARLGLAGTQRLRWRFAAGVE